MVQQVSPSANLVALAQAISRVQSGGGDGSSSCGKGTGTGTGEGKSAAPPQWLPEVLSCLTQKDLPAAVPFKWLTQLKAYAASAEGEGLPKRVYIHELLQGESIVKESRKQPEPHPDLLIRRAKLKVLAQEYEYKQLTKRVENAGKKFQLREPLDVKDTKRIFSLVLNLLVTMGACFAFGFFATIHVAPDLGMRVLAGVVCMIAAVGAELYFLIKTSIKED